MSFFEHPGLTFAFMLAADVAVAAFTGYVGIHTLLVDGGASLGQAMGVPHVDWSALFGGEGLEFLDPGSHVHGGAEAAGGGHIHDGQWHTEPHAPEPIAPAPDTGPHVFS